MSEKTYVFDNGETSNNGLLGLVTALCNKQGIDPGYLMAMMNQNGMNGGGWGWWIIILLIFGWGGFGNGGFGGNGGAQGLANLGNLVNNDAGRELLMNAIQGNANAIGQLSTKIGCDYNALNTAICNLQSQFSALGLGQRDIIAAVQSGNQSILTQVCDCCCNLRADIANFKGDVALQMCQQTNNLTNAINFVNSSVERGFASTQYETQAQTNAITRAIADQTTFINQKFCDLEMREMQNKIDSLRTENQTLRFAESQQAQNNYLISHLQPVPRPAYIVGSPYQSYGYPYGFGYNNGNCCCGNSNGCGY